MAIVEDIEESEQPTSSGPPITKVWHQLEHYLDRLKLPAELLRVDKEHPKRESVDITSFCFTLLNLITSHTSSESLG
jgi:hypothetical protein